MTIEGFTGQKVWQELYSMCQNTQQSIVISILQSEVHLLSEDMSSSTLYSVWWALENIPPGVTSSGTLSKSSVSTVAVTDVSVVVLPVLSISIRELA